MLTLAQRESDVLTLSTGDVPKSVRGTQASSVLVRAS